MMRRTFVSFFLLLALALPADAANRFWVGGTGSFSQTAHWSTTSGGGSGASVPGSADAAIIDSLSGGGIYTIDGSPTVLSFSFVNVNNTDALSLSGSLTISAGGSLSLTGNSVTNRAFVKSSVLGTQRNISVPSGATVTATNFDSQDINMTGTFSTGATASSIGDCLGNTFGWSSVQPDVSVSLTLASTGTINWSTATWNGTISRVPLPQDDVSLGNPSLATTLSADMPRLGRNIDASNYVKIFNLTSSSGCSAFGSFAISATGTFGGSANLILAGRGSQTLTSHGGSFSRTIQISAFGGAYTFQDGWTLTGSAGFSVSNGTFDAGSFNHTMVTFAAGGSATRSVKGSGTWSITLPSSSPWQTASTGLDTSALTATINFTGTCTTTVTFTGGGISFPGTLNWSSPTSTGTLIITGANTFADIRTDPSTARTIQLPASTTTTVSAFSAKGSAGNLLSLTSSTPGTKATLSKASGLVMSDYLSINDSAATGGAGWYAGAHSTDNGTNTGWHFIPVPTGGLMLQGLGG